MATIIGTDGQNIFYNDDSGAIKSSPLKIPGAKGADGAPGITGSISATSGPSPWVDIQAFGAFQRAQPDQTTTATVSANSTSVTLASAIDFVNGQGIVIYGAGNATSQSTPAAPTLSAPYVTGAASYKYQIVGVDALGGLTAASPVATINTGPAIFGNLPVVISSISQSSDTVTVNFSSPISASVGQMVSIQGVTGAGVGFNGLFPVATVPTNSQITYSLSGNAGSGTVSSSSTGRLCNAYNITAISRTGGAISITTNANHNYNANGIQDPTLVVIDGNLPADLNGINVITAASTDSITCGSTGIQASESSTQLGFVTVYECIEVLCPAPSGTTVTYYIYSDSPNPGGALQLIGKLRQGERIFRDYGPWLMQGFVAPSYVPTTPPASAQNQLFASMISSGAGTTSLTLADAAPSTVTSAVCLHDDGQAILQADAQCTKQGGGTIYLSPASTKDSSNQQRHYTLNYPITVNNPIVLSGALVCNETLTAFDIQSSWRGNELLNPQFGLQKYPVIAGKASPFIYTTGSLQLEGIGFFNNLGGGNGQTFVIQNCNAGQGHTQIRRCAFVDVNTSSTVVGFACLGEANQIHITDIALIGNSIIPAQELPGQTSASPPIPMLYFGYNSTAQLNPGIVVIDGACSINKRGIAYDFREVLSGLFASYCPQTFIDVASDFQAPQTPFFSVIGSNNAMTQVIIRGANMDSLPSSVLGSWNSGLTRVWIDNCAALAGTPNLITGYKIGILSVSGSEQNGSIGQDNSVGQWAISQSFTTTNETSDTVTINGATTKSRVCLTPTNASAAADVAAGNVYVSAKTTNQITVTHGATAGETFDILVTSC